MGIDVRMLPPAAQKQALKKLAEMERRKTEGLKSNPQSAAPTAPLVSKGAKKSASGGSDIRSDVGIAPYGEKRNGQNATGPASKYHAVKDSRGALKFDSRKEARRYDELMLMLRAGEIRDLKLQKQFTLQEAYVTPEGVRVRAIRYVCDFAYQRRAPSVGGAENSLMERAGRSDVGIAPYECGAYGRTPSVTYGDSSIGEGAGRSDVGIAPYRTEWIDVVEDVKSKATKTRVYAMKRKLMMERFGIEVTEV